LYAIFFSFPSFIVLLKISLKISFLANEAAGQKGYEASTIASRARSPSPYTRRRMAQLSVRDPFESAVETKPFKTELEERPNFVVRKVWRFFEPLHNVCLFA